MRTAPSFAIGEGNIVEEIIVIPGRRPRWQPIQGSCRYFARQEWAEGRGHSAGFACAAYWGTGDSSCAPPGTHGW